MPALRLTRWSRRRMGRCGRPPMLSARRSSPALPVCRSEGGFKWWSALRGSAPSRTNAFLSLFGRIFPPLRNSRCGVGSLRLSPTGAASSLSPRLRISASPWDRKEARAPGRRRWLRGPGAPPALAPLVPLRAAQIYFTAALLVLRYVAQVHCPPRSLEDLERRAVGRALCLPGNMLGRRWHVELAAAGGERFGSALAYVTACRMRAAITTVPDWAADVARLGAVVDTRGRWPISTTVAPCRGGGTCSWPPGHRL